MDVKPSHPVTVDRAANERNIVSCWEPIGLPVPFGRVCSTDFLKWTRARLCKWLTAENDTLSGFYFFEEQWFASNGDPLELHSFVIRYWRNGFDFLFGDEF